MKESEILVHYVIHNELFYNQWLTPKFEKMYKDILKEGHLIEKYHDTDYALCHYKLSKLKSSELKGILKKGELKILNEAFSNKLPKEDFLDINIYINVKIKESEIRNSVENHKEFLAYGIFLKKQEALDAFEKLALISKISNWPNSGENSVGCKNKNV